jgi:DNA gyrase subunit A
MSDNELTARIISTDLQREMAQSYLEYAMSVIVGRALPDARDGLKPVHRRILYAMHELGLTADRPFRKCARVVGDVIGKYHPHGDQAVYEALVRMAQDFSMRERLVDGHGNFGSIDNDPPAAMRYTECRLTAFAQEALLQDIDANTVDFIDNYDGSQQEPLVLPARIPQLLLNGSSGIAVGMATNIPPHNLGELVDGLIALIHNPNLTSLELMQWIPAPDFPTGGLIMGQEGIREAYTTGRGSITLRGVATVETIEQRGRPTREAIIITELPYQTNKAAMIEKIAELVNEKKLEGIADIRDESDREGMRVVIELKRDAQPQVVLNNLYKQTPPAEQLRGQHAGHPQRRAAHPDAAGRTAGFLGFSGRGDRAAHPLRAAESRRAGSPVAGLPFGFGAVGSGDRPHPRSRRCRHSPS